jgi:hypothetical protein
MGPNMDQFQLYDKIPTNTECSTYHDALIGNFTDSNLSRAFFCKENMQIIQNGIRAGVYKMSNGQYIIENQNWDTLKIIMRSIYLQSSTNQLNNITQQIQALNDLVLEYCIKHIYSEARAYIIYKKDVSTMYHPIDRPTLSNIDDKTLEFKRWF